MILGGSKLRIPEFTPETNLAHRSGAVPPLALRKLGLYAQYQFPKICAQD